MVLLCLRCGAPYLTQWARVRRIVYREYSSVRCGTEWVWRCPAVCPDCGGKEGEERL
jgi:hypothetical protein